MSQTTLIVLIALGATFAGFVLASNAQRLSGDDTEIETSVAAGPQTAELDWRETAGSPGEQIVFTVDRIDVTRDGLERARRHRERHLGRMGARSGRDARRLVRAAAVRDGRRRGARGAEPERHAAGDSRSDARTRRSSRGILEPGASWEGEISARGALVAGSWVRVVFGTLVAVGSKPPEEFDETLVWITDHAYELEP